MADTTQPATTPKTALAPDLRRMDDRAARAWVERMAVRPLDDSAYAVDSESGATYVVDFEDNSCTCPDHQIRNQICKHMRRVAIEISTKRVPPPGKRRATCAACGVETFIPREADQREASTRAGGEERPVSDEDEPHLCENCKLEPGDIVRDREADDREASARASGESEARSASRRERGGTSRERRPASRKTGDRLVVARVTPDRADEVDIPAAGCTVADYETNEDYPADDPVVEASYLGSAARSNDPKRYSFPLSRLELVDDAAIVD